MERNGQDVIRAASKSIWRERYTKDFTFYCPMCTSPRRIGMHPRPGRPIHFVQVGITALLLTLITAHFLPWIGWKAIVCFVPLWITFETIYRAKVRDSVACNQCGFDPVLYLVEPSKARHAIREHWRKRFEEKGIPFPEEDAENNALHSRLTAPSTSERNTSRQKSRGNSVIQSSSRSRPEHLEENP